MFFFSFNIDGLTNSLNAIFLYCTQTTTVQSQRNKQINQMANDSKKKKAVQDSDSYD
jgi:hypothetical protein